MRRGARRNKERKTFTLSPQSVTFLQKLATRYGSTSEALDALIEEKRRETEKQRISASMRSYYDSISDEERAENRAWGEFAESQFSQE